MYFDDFVSNNISFFIEYVYLFKKRVRDVSKHEVCVQNICEAESLNIFYSLFVECFFWDVS